MSSVEITAFKYAESGMATRFAFAGGEARRTITVAWLFFLVRVAGRNILVDTGVGSLRTILRAGFFPRRRVAPRRLLRAHGLEPGDIDEVVVTHAHFDHVADLELYPRAIIHAQKEEAGVFGPALKDPGRVATFEESTILHGCLELRRWGGHTKGSSIVLFEPCGLGHVLGGDECYVLENLERGIPTGNSVDPARSAAFVEEFRKPRYRVWLSHEPSIIPRGLGRRRLEPEGSSTAWRPFQGRGKPR